MQAVIRAKVGALETASLMGRAGRIATTRELVVTGTPYVVAYRVTPAGVQVLRVVHGARDWPGATG
jgi:toxin ParE1/3/4